MTRFPSLLTRALTLAHSDCMNTALTQEVWDEVDTLDEYDRNKLMARIVMRSPALVARELSNVRSSNASRSGLVSTS